MNYFVRYCLLFVALFPVFQRQAWAGDWWYDLQNHAVRNEKANWGFWGTDSKVYSSWTSHTNRLIPAYTFGIDMRSVNGKSSAYRSVKKIEQLYGLVPPGTFNPEAEYFDQTDIYHLQDLAVKSGKQRIILMVFDGMDWQTTWAAAIVKSRRVAYTEGRGSGLNFQDYRGTTTDFGFFVSSPHNTTTTVDIDAQRVPVPGGHQKGGYSARFGGPFPWSRPLEPLYPIGKSPEMSHAYTDSASSATSLTAGVKTYNGAINVDPAGTHVEPIAQRLQRAGWAVGVVTSVPISHATPSCAYANNVHRADYQDIMRDFLGLPSISHPQTALPGLDVIIGAGHGIIAKADVAQGKNFEPGNRYIAPSSLTSLEQDGRFEVALRTKNRGGPEVLAAATQRAVKNKTRLFGMFGCSEKHLPFQTANGDYNPALNVPLTKVVPLVAVAEKYTPADILENPTLSHMTSAALNVLSSRSDRFWLMIEAGDVDWANHKNNIDNSVGAVFSGDQAFKTLTNWIEENGGWKDTAVIVTADHGHYLTITKPGVLTSLP